MVRVGYAIFILICMVSRGFKGAGPPFKENYYVLYFLLWIPGGLRGLAPFKEIYYALCLFFYGLPGV